MEKLKTLETKGCDLTDLTAKVDSIIARLGAGVIPTAPPADPDGLAADATAIATDAMALEIKDRNNHSTVASAATNASELSVISGKISGLRTKVERIPFIHETVRAAVVGSLRGAIGPLGDTAEKTALTELLNLVVGKPAASHGAPPGSTPAVDTAPILAALRKIKDETTQIQPIQDMIEWIQTEMAKGQVVGDAIATLKELLVSYGLNEKFAALRTEFHGVTETLGDILERVSNPANPLQTEFHGVNETLADILERVSNLPNTIDPLRSELHLANETLADILERVSNLSLREIAAEVEGRVAPLLTGIEERLTAMAAGLNEIKEDTTAIRDELGTIKTDTEGRNAAAAIKLDTIEEKLDTGIEERLTAMAAGLNEIKEDTTAIRDEVDTIKTDTEGRNAAAASKLDTIEEKLDMLVANHTRSDDEIQTKLDGMAADFNQQMEILAETAEQIDRIEELIRATHGEDSPLARALQDHANHTAAQLNALEAANHGGRNDEQIALIQRLVEASQELQRRLGDCDGKDTRIAELERQLATRQAELDGLQGSATAAHGSVEQLTATAAQRNQEVARLTSQIEGLTRERDDAVATSGSKDAEIAEARRTIANLETEMAAIRTSLASLEAQVGRNGRNARITALEEEKTALETRLRECEEGKTALQTQITALERGAGNAAGLREQLAEQTRACQEAAAEAAARYAAQLQEATAARDEAIRSAVANAGAAKNTDIQGLQGQLRDCNEQKTALQTELQALRERCDEEKAALQTELDTARARIAELEGQLATVGQERNNARAAGDAAAAGAVRNAAAARAAAEQAAANAAAARAAEEARLAAEQEAARAAEEARTVAAARLPAGSSVNDQIKAFKADFKLPYITDKITKIKRHHPIADALKTATDLRPVIEAYANPGMLSARLETFFSTQGGAVIKRLIPQEFSNPAKTLQNIFTLFNNIDAMRPPWRGGSRKRKHRNKSARHTRRRQ
jgi:chromosome segregation ATPase